MESMVIYCAGIGRAALPAALLATAVILTMAVYATVRRRVNFKKSRVVFPSYDPSQNMFYYPQDVLQQEFGYRKLYDENAIAQGMVLDCEPVHFEWGGRRWLIEFWKGQYGVASGAEIGVYSCDAAELDSEFYPETDNTLDIKMELVCGNKIIFTKQNQTWWLSGFAAGMFAQPKQLKLEVQISLLVPSMAEEFISELQRMGYDGDEAHISGRIVKVTYSKPKSAQPYTRTRLAEVVQQLKNKFNARYWRHIVKTRAVR